MSPALPGHGLALAGAAAGQRPQVAAVSAAVPGHLHPGPAERAVVHPPLATGRPDHDVGDGQPEARAAAILAGGPVEPVEQPVPFFLGDARAAVLDGQADLAALAADHDPDGGGAG